MENDKSQPMQTAARYAVISAFASILLFIGFIFAGLYIPENFFILNTNKVSSLREWMPDEDKIPAEMLLVKVSTFSNGDVAKNYADPAAMRTLLDSFGRLDGIAKEYSSFDRCRTVGPRWLHISIVAHKSAQGAQQYNQWLREKDQTDGIASQNIDIADGGYLEWSTDEGVCPSGKSTRILTIAFTRNQYLGTIKLLSAREQNPMEKILKWGTDIANALDEKLQTAPAPK